LSEPRRLSGGADFAKAPAAKQGRADKSAAFSADLRRRRRIRKRLYRPL